MLSHNAQAKRQASHIIASGASLRKSLDRSSDPLAARMYEAVLILNGASSLARPKARAVEPAHRLVARPNDFIVIALDRRGRSRIVIRPLDDDPAINDAGSALIVAPRAKSWPRITSSVALSPAR